MFGSDRISKAALLAIAAFLGMIAVRPYVSPETKVAADSGRYDYASVVSPAFLYQGKQGILLVDKPLMADGPATLNDENVPDSLVEELTSCGAFSEQRNGNVWFLARNGDNMRVSYADPVFVLHVPLEKLDEQAR